MFEPGFVSRLQIFEIVGAAPQTGRTLSLGRAVFVYVRTIGVVIIDAQQIRDST